MEVASIRAFRRHPERFFEWLRPLIDTARSARPNPAHDALAQLERMGLVRVLLTQNIDGLHQQAGSENVVELHGSVRQGTCQHCGRTVDGAWLMDAIANSTGVPACPECGGVVKPDVTLFGEMLPPAALQAAFYHSALADLILVAGSSLEVSPAADLPRSVVERAGKLIIVNRQPTPLDALASVVLRENVELALPRLVSVCRERRNVR